MSDYRESELPFEGGIGDFCKDTKSLLKLIKHAIRHKCEVTEEQKNKMEDMYFYKDNLARERIYHTLADKQRI